MNRTLLLVAGVLMVTSIAKAQTTGPTTAPVREDPEEVRLSVGRPDEYDAVIADLKLEGEELERFQEADRRRRDGLQAFVDSPEGIELVRLREQLAAARREKRSDEVGTIRNQIQPLSEQYWTVRNHGRLELLALLSVDQQKQLVGFTIRRRLERSLAGAALSDPQQQQVRAICDEVGAAWWSPERVQADPFFRNLQPQTLEAEKRVRDLLSTQ
jgi:hypothetical protein